MKNFLSLFLLMITFMSCDDREKSFVKGPFKEFDFSYSDTFRTTFSVKFANSDTVFIYQYFSSKNNETAESNKTYFAVLPESDKIKLDSILRSGKFSGFDTLYWQPYEDGVEYQFYFRGDNLPKRIRIHSADAPAQLMEFSKWIVKLKERLSLKEMDTIINFKSQAEFYPYPVREPPNVILKNK